MTDPVGGEIRFEHDRVGNLTKTIFGDGKEQLRNPDKVGNLFESPDQKDRKYDQGGKLLEIKGTLYKYDSEGNLIEKKEKNGKRWLYEWNSAGMLAKVIRPDQEPVSFGYDALGRRLWKRYGNTITKWVWDGNKPLHEWKEHALTGAILSDTKVGTDGIITWLFEEDSFAPVAKLKGEKKYSIITDHLGTPSQMYNEEGKLFWQGSLDSYGRMRMERGEAGSCPFRYQGQYEDKEIGLYYNRFRYYSPEEGRYISQDPIRLAGGNRLYGYVDDPTGWVDILGLTYKRLPANPNDVPNLFTHVTMTKTAQADGKIIHQFEHDGKQFKIEFHPNHGGADHFDGDHYHIKQLSSTPPPGKTNPVWFRLANTDPHTPAMGGTFAPGDLLPTILQ